ncbi:uncharacterized protein BDZ99DRAFT_211441 [Mytilinidion resinicola]|uniref:Uncharacterized protein n=1 Tax=Mytilinidion resinicola TaxID=574789 RepID=A0A6A6XZE1_9PEZI|nr:uncharacterized protein BDZ99DRAFT_211441 [Mytilinidion resinicola]KAF2801931.1 hypothetical protein BDZ99DRAFT_211441 [Mytilinidion resinicola]
MLTQAPLYRSLQQFADFAPFLTFRITLLDDTEIDDQMRAAKASVERHERIWDESEGIFRRLRQRIRVLRRVPQAATKRNHISMPPLVPKFKVRQRTERQTARKNPTNLSTEVTKEVSDSLMKPLIEEWAPRDPLPPAASTTSATKLLEQGPSCAQLPIRSIARRSRTGATETAWTASPTKLSRKRKGSLTPPLIRKYEPKDMRVHDQKSSKPPLVRK